MDAKCIVLKLVLDELGVSDSIAMVDDRKRVQKAIYLGQRAGLDLGYRFSWYLMGPYSPGLTRDYYALAESLNDGEQDYVERELLPPARKHLQKIKSLMTPPRELAGRLSQEDWLELVASVDYLLRVRKCDLAEAEAVMKREKTPLAPYFADAIKAIHSHGLAGSRAS